MILTDLLHIKERELAARKKITLRCCMAAGCMSSDAKGIKEQLEKAVAADIHCCLEITRPSRAADSKAS
jgi:bidirectional [NiFe] hydrogenase diaphorase subunit